MRASGDTPLIEADRTWGEDINVHIVAADVAVGSNGDVIVVGGQTGGPVFYSPFPVIRAYDDNGAEHWSDAPDVSNLAGYSFFTSVATDSTDRIIVQGGSPSEAPWYKLRYVYDADGVVTEIDSPLDEGVETLVLESAIGGDDSIYRVAFGATSSLTRQSNAAVDVWTIELPSIGASGVGYGANQIAAAGAMGASAWIGTFDEDGVDLWSETIDGVAGAAFNGVAVDSDGSVIAVGRRFDNDDHHAWVRKYTAAGVVLWEMEFDGAASLDHDEAWDVSLDAAGNVYVATRRAGDADATWVVKLTP